MSRAHDFQTIDFDGGRSKSEGRQHIWHDLRVSKANNRLLIPSSGNRQSFRLSPVDSLPPSPCCIPVKGLQSYRSLELQKPLTGGGYLSFSTDVFLGYANATVSLSRLSIVSSVHGDSVRLLQRKCHDASRDRGGYISAGAIRPACTQTRHADVQTTLQLELFAGICKRTAG